MNKRKTTEQKWHEQSEATKEEAAKLPCGDTQGENAAKGQPATHSIPDQSVAIVARPTGPHVTNNPRGRLSWRRDQSNLFFTAQSCSPSGCIVDWAPGFMPQKSGASRAAAFIGDENASCAPAHPNEGETSC